MPSWEEIGENNLEMDRQTHLSYILVNDFLVQVGNQTVRCLKFVVDCQPSCIDRRKR